MSVSLRAAARKSCIAFLNWFDEYQQTHQVLRMHGWKMGESIRSSFKSKAQEDRRLDLTHGTRLFPFVLSRIRYEFAFCEEYVEVEEADVNVRMP